MGLYTKLADDIQEVDVIIAGGGTAGCVIAGRLAEADPGLSILVIEGGRNNVDLPSVVYPGLFLQNIQPATRTALFYKGNKSRQLGDREPIVPSGGVLGGGSSINFMAYVRPQRSDYDSWNTPGWSTNELLPYMKKLETYHGPGEAEHHGYNGPVHVSSGTYRAKAPEGDFIQAAGEVGYQEFRDMQDLDASNGVERWQRYIGPNGRRQDAASTYLHPKLQDGEHPNLHVVVESQVSRILFDQKRAVGVEYRPNPEYQATVNLSQQPLCSVRARKLVIVTCGALGTPPVLERSGLGDPLVLGRAGVPVIEPLPGVGHDYQDHHLIMYPYRTNLKPEETLDEMLSGRVDAAGLTERDDRRLGWNSLDVFGKIRPTESEVSALGPDFRRAWDRDFKNVPDRPLMLLGMLNCFLGDPASVPVGQYATTGTYTAYPYSRGSMHITGPSLDSHLDFETGFFNDVHDIDIKKQIWAYKKQREVMRRTAMYRGEVSAGHPRFAAHSPAACIETDTALENVRDIEYSAEDDAAIEQWLRENINTTWHSLGTCKMAPREQMGVVDANLNVHGVLGLKIADVSIAPENVGANTNNTALTIGEKAADIIVRELGLHTG
ncbi:hypothetical protein DL764_000052 [Monosporascus ibericus]|uniref:Glucose-methanol-choline oxidoreductase N-terminal domain-containing protein n=1 Tax=Monosporascus ibericus TaxID=155417 RepID=A0A4Q4TWY2_9PEZI|nr:hypothetical protein DL764_000052 [Monosporascus ibericus]